MVSRGFKLLAAITCFVIAGIAVPSPAAAVDDTVRRMIVNENDDRCLDVESGAADSTVHGDTCGFTLQPKWDIIHIGTDTVGKYYRLKYAYYSNSCLLARTWGAAAYKAVGYPCLAYDDQYWYLPQSGVIFNK